MTTFLLSAHVVVAIVAIGPVTVAASMFAPAVRAALRDPADARAAGVVGTLHRICTVYAAIGIAVPILGFATAASMGVLGDPWLIISIALTGVAAGVLALGVLPAQQQLVDLLGSRAAAVSARNVAVASGLFSLLWTVVTVLMIARPGSTTGV